MFKATPLQRFQKPHIPTFGESFAQGAGEGLGSLLTRGIPGALVDIGADRLREEFPTAALDRTAKEVALEAARDNMRRQKEVEDLTKAQPEEPGPAAGPPRAWAQQGPEPGPTTRPRSTMPRGTPASQTVGTPLGEPVTAPRRGPVPGLMGPGTRAGEAAPATERGSRLGMQLESLEFGPGATAKYGRPPSPKDWGPQRDRLAEITTKGEQDRLTKASSSWVRPPRMGGGPRGSKPWTTLDAQRIAAAFSPEAGEIALRVVAEGGGGDLFDKYTAEYDARRVLNPPAQSIGPQTEEQATEAPPSVLRPQGITAGTKRETDVENRQANVEAARKQAAELAANREAIQRERIQVQREIAAGRNASAAEGRLLSSLDRQIGNIMTPPGEVKAATEERDAIRARLAAKATAAGVPAGKQPEEMTDEELILWKQQHGGK